MRPSETASGQTWLGNFAEFDRDAAVALIDSLRLVTFTELWSGLRLELVRLVETGALCAPLLALPEQNLRHFGVAKDRAVAYEDFLPGDPARAANGSDAFVSMVLRDLPLAEAATGPPELLLSTDASIEAMRAAHVRSIVIVTDYSGSGGQVISLAESLVRNATIRSWRSRGWLRICVLAFAASPGALERLEKCPAIDDARSVEVAPSLDSLGLLERERETIEELCRQEALGRVSADMALGFQSSGGLLVTERRAPNNLPAVFWQSPNWSPLFPGFDVPSAFVKEVGVYTPGPKAAELAQRAGQSRLGKVLEVKSLRASSAALEVTLAEASRGRCQPVQVSQLTRLNLPEAEKLIRSTIRLGLIDELGNLTQRGRQELDASKRGMRRNTAGTEFPVGGDYYPLHLR